eukprot:6200737-Pleurochrysis_carterae.AAC.1
MFPSASKSSTNLFFNCVQPSKAHPSASLGSCRCELTACSSLQLAWVTDEARYNHLHVDHHSVDRAHHGSWNHA